MSELERNNPDFKLPVLSTAELVVLYVLRNESVRQDDIKTIAELCNLTKLQTNLAVQLLQIKKIYPYGHRHMNQENPA
jgi:hypothetical protein